MQPRQPLEWAIRPAKPGEGNVLGLKIVDAQEADASWVFFFTGVSHRAYPRVLEAAARGIGSGYNAGGVTFPADLDEWDINERGGPLPEDSVELYHHDFGSTILPQATFYTILQAVAERLLAQPGQPAGWYEAMRTALAKLQAKLAGS